MPPALLRPGASGVGLQSAFGLKTEYGNGWAGRYQALKSELTTINLRPSLAYAVHERLSIGMGRFPGISGATVMS